MRGSRTPERVTSFGGSLLVDSAQNIRIIVI